MAGETRSRRSRLHGTAGLAVLGAAVAMALVLVPSALSGRVSGAISTTTNPAFDNHSTGSPVLCNNGPGNTTPSINCNLYTAKPYVWLTGLPGRAALVDGTYFFVVVAPGGQNADVADGSPKNLSSPYGPYTTREFSISNGVITNLGTHVYDPVTNLLRLFPYADTPNPGGEYDVAVCKIGPQDTSATVNSSNCKHDNFKAQKQQVGVTPDLATTILNDVNGLPFEGSAPAGAVVHDLATLAPTSDGIPTGTVSFTWFTNIDCTGSGTSAGSAAVDAGGIANGSASEGPLPTGDYSFAAHFTSSNTSRWTDADSACEPLQVVGEPAVTPDLGTTLLNDINGLPFEGSAPEDVVVRDVAFVAPTSDGIPTGTVSFTWFTSFDCTGPGTSAGSAPVDAGGLADGSAAVGPLPAGEYSFVAHFTSSNPSQWTDADSPCEPLVVVG